jgi:hypothetical protein
VETASSVVVLREQQRDARAVDAAGRTTTCRIKMATGENPPETRLHKERNLLLDNPIRVAGA